MLNCRRCQSALLLKLARLGRNDHTVYRCRACGFLFSPPDGDGGDAAGFAGDGGGGPAPVSSPSSVIPTSAIPSSIMPADIIPAAPPLSAVDIRQRQRDAGIAGAAGGDAVYPHTYPQTRAGRRAAR